MIDFLIYELTKEDHALGYFICKNYPQDCDENVVLNKMSLSECT